MPDIKPFRLPAISAADALAQAREGAALIDLRPAAKVAVDGRRIDGAEVCDARRLGHDDALTKDSRRLIVFCQKGEEIGHFGCALLMMHGRDVAYVTGGIMALIDAGAPAVKAEEMP